MERLVRWARALSAKTNRVNLLRPKRENAFQPDLVFPPISEVILVEKSFSEPEVEIGQEDDRRM